MSNPRLAALGFFLLLLGPAQAGPAETGAGPGAPIVLGGNRELFVDTYLIDRLSGTRLVMHEPHFANVALRFDQPWEGDCTGFFTVLKDGDIFRMYYVGLPLKVKDEEANAYVCYAESRDGISWTRPDLELCDFQGSKKNNILFLPNGQEPYAVNFSAFIDQRPGVPASERFKAVGGTSQSSPKGLYVLTSGDGIHWRKWRDRPVFDRGAFDTQNVAFWSRSESCYVLYIRVFAQVQPRFNPLAEAVSGASGCRTIARVTSPDLVHWSEPQRMSFGHTPLEQLYTNATEPYFRAPQIYISFPMRFVHGRRFLTDAQFAARSVAPIYDTPDVRQEVSDSVFMTSRGGTRYERTFLEAFIRPGPDLGNWISRDGMTARGVVPTGPAEMSVYHQSNYAQPTGTLGRYTLRTDGFASVNAPYGGGEMITKPLVISGRDLRINFATSAVGSVRVEVQDPDGEPIPGFSLVESRDLLGDSIDFPVRWGKGSDLGPLVGRPVRLRFVMKDADLYSLSFR